MIFEGYCDASCSGNPGPGAPAAVLVAREGTRVVQEREIVGQVEPFTTNQREELKGAILILEALKRPVAITVTSDSRYLVDGMTRWVPNWLRNGWVNSKKEAVANQDLWRRLVDLAAGHDIRWNWVKGHAGHPYNERCDRLAVAAVDAYKRSPRQNG